MHPSPPDFSAVYDEHVWRVYGFLAYRVRSRADAEDLTQLTFERALRAWGRYDSSRASPATWLLVIARNLLVDHARADRSAVLRPVGDADDAALPVAWDRHDLGLDPSVERALAELSDQAREVIGLRFGGDLTGPEIAALTGLSLANVQQILSRALRQLRTSIEAASDAAAAESTERAGHVLPAQRS
jgi:RNA polymerase sigma-70 factor (ECF subfamily)